MACFIVPATEAIVTTIAAKVIKNHEESVKVNSSKSGSAEISEKVPFSRKLGWLNKMLWGGSALLALEHVWHGEVVPWYPFLTAASDPESKAEMLREMSTVGVTMAILVTTAWVGMVVASHLISKRATKIDTAENKG